MKPRAQQTTSITNMKINKFDNDTRIDLEEKFVQMHMNDPIEAIMEVYKKHLERLAKMMPDQKLSEEVHK